jgi:hypothetical protein
MFIFLTFILDNTITKLENENPHINNYSCDSAAK